jgi:aminoglycoside 6'-N-acetyltransferase I
MEIRRACLTDAPLIAALLVDLGYTATAADVMDRLPYLDRTGADPMFLALAEDGAAGLLALHCCRMLQYAAPVMRIAALVVSDGARGRGIGAALIERAIGEARERGCAGIELTSGLEREGAHAFYRALGFTATSYKFFRKIEPDEGAGIRTR